MQEREEAREEAREKQRKKEKAIRVNHDGIEHKPRAREKTRVYVRSRDHEKDKHHNARAYNTTSSRTHDT